MARFDRWSCDRWVVGQDLGLEFVEDGARLDPEIFGELAAPALVDLQRLCLPASAVQGDHQLSPQPFAQRIGGHRALEFGNELAVAPDASSASNRSSNAAMCNSSMRVMSSRKKVL